MTAEAKKLGRSQKDGLHRWLSSTSSTVFANRLLATELHSLRRVLGPRALHVCWHQWHPLSSSSRLFIALLVFLVHCTSVRQKTVSKLLKSFRTTTHSSISTSILRLAYFLRRFSYRFFLPNLVLSHTNPTRCYLFTYHARSSVRLFCGSHP